MIRKEWLKEQDAAFIKRLPTQAPRSERLERLRMYYLLYLVEDPVDGTKLDCAVLDAIKRLELEFENDL